ncbi:hypothetical protein [Mesobaculum littorinae]|uniref:hypothetical protein n=1 Tax=Mesobaculum littorinae TaxID=2486419 RepID=UPI0013E3C30A|nr:hypothetical protein [Mesobaculum littorinae]
MARPGDDVDGWPLTFDSIDCVAEVVLNSQSPGHIHTQGLRHDFPMGPCWQGAKPA